MLTNLIYPWIVARKQGDRHTVHEANGQYQEIIVNIITLLGTND